MIYIDDMLIRVGKVGLTSVSASLRTNFILEILGLLRIRLSLDKLQMSPTTTLVFLGKRLNTRTGSIVPTLSKITELAQLIVQACDKRFLSLNN